MEKHKKTIRKCTNCGKRDKIRLSLIKEPNYTGLCKQCRMTLSFSGKNHYNWKGGRMKLKGYIGILLPEHPLSNSRGYALEHRVIAAKKWGLGAVIGNVVHHINGDITDNRVENLEIVTNSDHMRMHKRTKTTTTRLKDEPNPTIKCACGCGNERLKYDTQGIPRSFLKGHGNVKTDSNSRLPGEPNPNIKCCCGCGRERPKYDKLGILRRFIQNHYHGELKARKQITSEVC